MVAHHATQKNKFKLLRSLESSTPSSVFARCLRDRALFETFSNLNVSSVGNSEKKKIADNSGRRRRKFLKISDVIEGHYPYPVVPPYCHAHFRFRR